MFGFDDAIVAAGISAAGSLIGGAMAPSSREQRKQQEQLQKEMDYRRPTWIRGGAEAAGFNPLVFAGPTGSAPSLSPLGNPIGDSIARAAATVADGFGQAADLDMRKAELDLERERLELLREEVKLRPQVPGIYGTGNTPSMGSGVGGGVGAAATTPTKFRTGEYTPIPTPIVPTASTAITYDSTGRPYEVSPGMNLPMTHTETIDVFGTPLTFALPGAEEMEDVTETFNRLFWATPQVPYQFFKRGGELAGRRMEDAWKDRRANPEKYREPVPRVDQMSDEELARALRGN